MHILTRSLGPPYATRAQRRVGTLARLRARSAGGGKRGTATSCDKGEVVFLDRVLRTGAAFTRKSSASPRPSSCDSIQEEPLPLGVRPGAAPVVQLSTTRTPPGARVTPRVPPLGNPLSGAARGPPTRPLVSDVDDAERARSEPRWRSRPRPCPRRPLRRRPTKGPRARPAGRPGR